MADGGEEIGNMRRIDKKGLCVAIQTTIQAHGLTCSLVYIIRDDSTTITRAKYAKGVQ